MEIAVAEALIRCLELEGVEVIFGYPGGSILPVYDALFNTKRIKHILVRHEQGAVHAADAYARATGKVGVVFATSGPGATNLITGIANAYMDSVPLVLITGQVQTDQIGTDAFQEVDITGISMPITKHNYLVKDGARLPSLVKNAFHIAATGRPGPVLIDLPKDVASEVIDFKYPEEVNLRSYKPTYRGHPNKVAEAASLITKAERPVIYAGGGVISAKAEAELLELAEKLSAPVTNTFMGLSGFPGDHPLFLGMLGLHGTRYANLAVTNCDVLIALGARFDDRVTGRLESFASNAAIVHVDIDPAEIGKNVRVNVPIVGDVRQVIKAISKQVGKKDRSDWLRQIQQWKDQYPMTYSREGGLKPQTVIECLYRHSGGEAVVVTDVGQHQMWVAQYYPFDRKGLLISSGGLGTMGFGLPAAMGVQIGLPDRLVLLVTGDGSIQMTIQELATIVEQKLPVKVFVLNNRCLGMVRQLQELYCQRRYIATEFSFVPDFALLAKAYGIAGHTVKSEQDLEAILPEVLASREAVIVDCLVDTQENVSPIVMPGKGIDEAIDC